MMDARRTLRPSICLMGSSIVCLLIVWLTLEKQVAQMPETSRYLAGLDPVAILVGLFSVIIGYVLDLGISTLNKRRLLRHARKVSL